MKTLKNVLKTGLVTTALLGAFQTFAGAGSSGGGNAVVCFKNSQSIKQIKENDGWIKTELFEDMESVELLDLYQAKLPRGMFNQNKREIVKAYENESVDEYLKRIIDTVGSQLPLVRSIIGWGERELTNRIAQPNGLRPIYDYNSFGMVDNSKCIVATIIAQYSIGSDSYIQYDPRFYSLPHSVHAKESKALSLLHEYIYYTAPKGDEGSSNTTRMLVGDIVTIGSSIGKIINTSHQFVEEAKGYGFSSFGYDDTELQKVLKRFNNFIKNKMGDSSGYLTKLSKYSFFESQKKFNKRCSQKATSLSKDILNLFEKEWEDEINELSSITDEIKKSLIADMKNKFIERSNLIAPYNIHPAKDQKYNLCALGLVNAMSHTKAYHDFLKTTLKY